MSMQWADLMLQKGLTLACAESCTGGGLSAQITDVAGISAVFQGGCVTYSNQAKADLLGVPMSMIQTHGAVSSEVAQAMAQGARTRLHADYALATTGIAGPAGGTVEKPVGLVWMALASPEGVQSRCQVFPGDRSEIRAQACDAMLDWLSRELVSV